ncbi:hypothetical protein N4G70_36810 [Streptomyces sp. ASQP_92]|uniref:hypothetical protein n=1 Tax=Streptomyces sp. ASQP_92 TaxID=2979116 RepID=UPI0021BE5B68|nr:hypothetical protein [Streptomyces sp. ASQP_92]MCT9094354.1 hypothetical protein [Streptomyces sp. ASQP_92]
MVVFMVVGPPLAWGVSFAYAFMHAGESKTNKASCTKAMTSIGWKLPRQADRQQCTEISDPFFASAWAGTFHMPRAEARTWLLSLPGDRSHRVAGAGPDGVAERKEGLHLNIVPPVYGQVDEVNVEVQWESQEDAVVTFETYNG